MLKLAMVLLRLFLKRSTGEQAAASGNVSPLLRMRHPIRTVHMLPGRVRFNAPVLVGRVGDAERVTDALQRVQGVKDVVCDHRTGSVLIHYDAERLEAEILYAALIRLLGLEQELHKPPVSLLRREGLEALQALNRAVYDQTGGLIDLYSAAGILAGAVAVNRLVLRHLNAPGLLFSTWLVLRARR